MTDSGESRGADRLGVEACTVSARARSTITVVTALAVVVATVALAIVAPPAEERAGELDGRTWLTVPTDDGAEVVLVNGFSGRIEARARHHGDLDADLDFANSTAAATLLTAGTVAAVVRDGDHSTTVLRATDAVLIDDGGADAHLVAVVDDGIEVTSVATGHRFAAALPADVLVTGTPLADDAGRAHVVGVRLGEPVLVTVHLDDGLHVRRRTLPAGTRSLVVVDGQPLARIDDGLRHVDDMHVADVPADAVVATVAHDVDVPAWARGGRIHTGDGAAPVAAGGDVVELASWGGAAYAIVTTPDGAKVVRVGGGVVTTLGSSAVAPSFRLDGGLLWAVADTSALAIWRDGTATAFDLAEVDLEVCVAPCDADAFQDQVAEAAERARDQIDRDARADSTTTEPRPVQLPDQEPIQTTTTDSVPATTTTVPAPPTSEAPAAATTARPTTTVAAIPSTAAQASPPTTPPPTTPAPTTTIRRPASTTSTAAPPPTVDDGVALALDVDVRDGTGIVTFFVGGRAADCSAGAATAGAAEAQLAWKGAATGRTTTTLRWVGGSARSQVQSIRIPDVDGDDLTVQLAACSKITTRTWTDPAHRTRPELTPIGFAPHAPTPGSTVRASVGVLGGDGWALTSTSWRAGPCGETVPVGDGTTLAVSFLAPTPGAYCASVIASFADGETRTSDRTDAAVDAQVPATSPPTSCPDDEPESGCPASITEPCTPDDQPCPTTTEPGCDPADPSCASTTTTVACDPPGDEPCPTTTTTSTPCDPDDEPCPTTTTTSTPCQPGDEPCPTTTTTEPCQPGDEPCATTTTTEPCPTGDASCPPDSTSTTSTTAPSCNPGGESCPTTSTTTTTTEPEPDASTTSTTSTAPSSTTSTSTTSTTTTSVPDPD